MPDFVTREYLKQYSKSVTKAKAILTKLGYRVEFQINGNTKILATEVKDKGNATYKVRHFVEDLTLYKYLAKYGIHNFVITSESE